MVQHTDHMTKVLEATVAYDCTNLTATSFTSNYLVWYMV